MGCNLRRHFKNKRNIFGREKIWQLATSDLDWCIYKLKCDTMFVQKPVEIMKNLTVSKVKQNAPKQYPCYDY